MSPDFVLTIIQNAIKVLLFATLPLLSVALVVGLLISIFQAATQLQEMTLTFIPKIIAVFVALLMLSPWMLGMMVDYTRDIIINIPEIIR